MRTRKSCQDADLKIVALTSRITELENNSKIDGLTNRIKDLERGQEETEQYSRRNCLRFWPKEPERDGEDTDSMIRSYADKLGVCVVEVTTLK